jgi:hypothetical protein
MLLTFVLLSCGCAHYEYNITKPPELSRHVGTKLDEVVARDPLEYRLRTVENLLVMRVYNQTDGPIMLMGDRSYVVDPSGQSHPLLPQTIAPRSFIKLIFPPQRPVIQRSGPSIGIGVGTSIGSARHRYDYSGYNDPFYNEPRYFTIADNDTLYWNWNDESDVRMTLLFQQGDRTFTHEFTVARKKM